MIDIAKLHEVAINVTEGECPESALDCVVNGLADLSEIALARIWLIGPGDLCDGCKMRDICPDQTECLHLNASAGKSQNDVRTDWYDIGGSMRRVPIGERKIGMIAKTGESVHIEYIREQSEWVFNPEWIESEGIVSFVGHALKFRGEIFGVLAVFSRERICVDAALMMKHFADHAGAALANARAFEEIQSLRDRLAEENAFLREEVRVQRHAGGIVGESPKLTKVIQQIELVAPTDSTVLIEGESGTGKELVAQAIHETSNRRDAAFIRVNCASIPAELFESEFFGHVKGAFTGAVNDRVGRFALADGGTIFLDEIGEVPIALQSKLLRVLQEGTFERIGDTKTQRVDVRVIAATNRDLLQASEAGAFRQDLYYRLSVFPIVVPPLRERPEDIPLLADHFLNVIAKRYGLKLAPLADVQIDLLRSYDWPGNIRELQNVIERAAIIARDGRVEFDLPGIGAVVNANAAAAANDTVLTYDQLKDIEAASIRAALQRSGGKVSGKDGAAELLGIKPNTLSARMKTMGIERKAV